MSGQESHAASVTLVSGWIYALMAFLPGLRAGSRVKAASASVIALWVTVLAYYLTKAAQGDFTQASYDDPTEATIFTWGDFLSTLALWCVLAVPPGTLCSLSVYFAHNGPCRLIFRLLVPFVALCETSMRLSAEASRQEPLVGATWTMTRLLAIAGILCLFVSKPSVPGSGGSPGEPDARGEHAPGLLSALHPRQGS